MFQQKPENVSPQGKQNVYFICHPEDHDKYFEKIYKDIRKYSNCIVWYNTDENYDTNDIIILEKMNLFVIPITTKLLTEQCRAITHDVPYAFKNNKPILPLMQESGLDELFYKHFNDLQYLAPNSHDLTAISYDEKLKKYINFHLLDDKLAEKIRSAFDAYIFLSYRKKDREYANQLIRLIHQNDFCRDIAIWYDEYLNPGENFNEAILKAIQKSELFTMVVTPNLVNEENYVKNDEYPAALHRKKILPVEMEQTNYKLLKEQYPEIPKCIDGYNDIELSKALEESLVEIACRENDKEPQHNFFIGLAYLYGIDIEINYERALQLITSAAESNEVPEAIEKLVSMYKDGHGVKRNYYSAIEWQQKLVDYWKKEYFENNKNAFQKYLFELWNLGNQLFEKNIEAAECVYNEMLELCNKSPEKDNRYNLSVCYERLSYICEARDDYKGALFFYRKALPLIEQLSRENISNETKSNLSISYEYSGYLWEKLGDLKAAENFHLKSLSLRKELIKQTGETEFSCRLLWESYFWLGNIYEKYGHIAKANSYYQEALILSKKMAKDSRTYMARRNLFLTYEKLGEICKLQDNLNKAEEYYQICLVITQQLTEETGSIESKRNLSISFERLGDIRTSFGQWKEAEIYYSKSLAISKQLYEEIRTPESQRDLSASYVRLGNVNVECGNFVEAEKLYLESLALRKSLVKKSDSIPNKCNLALIYSNLGDFYKHCNNLKLAEKYYKQEILINEQLIFCCKDNAEIFDHLAVSYIKLATIKEPYNKDLLYKSLQIYTTLIQECPDVVRYYQNKDIIEKTLE